MSIHDYKVRFGDISIGPFLHASKLFDLNVQAMEELSYRIDYPIEEVTAAGHIPFATIVTTGTMQAYPRFEDTIRIQSDPVDVGERSFQVENAYRRREDGQQYGTVNTVHAVIDSTGTAVELPTAVRDALTDRETTSSSETLIDRPTNVDQTGVLERADEPSFDHTVTVWSPQLEAAGAAYYEDYFRFISETLESYLANTGPSLKERSTGCYPYKPVEWTVQFDAPTGYGERLRIEGYVVDSTDDEITVTYALRGEQGSRKAICNFVYGCFGETNERVPFPDDAVIGLNSML